MGNTIGFIGVILSVITASIMLNNSIHGRMDHLQSEIDNLRSELRADMDTLRTELHGDMDAFQTSIRNEISIIRADIKDLQARTSVIEGKLELLIDAWDIAQPSLPAIAKQ